MTDRDTRRARGEMQRRLEALDWNDISRRLRMRGMKRGLSPEDAKEAAQDTIARFLDPQAKPWNADETPLHLHLGSIHNSVVWAKRTKASAKNEVVSLSSVDKPKADHKGETGEDFDKGKDVNDQGQAHPGLIDIAERDHARKTLELLAKRLEGDEIALAALAEIASGLRTPKEIALAIGHPHEEVARACRRIEYNARAALRELEAPEESSKEAS